MYIRCTVRSNIEEGCTLLRCLMSYRLQNSVTDSVSSSSTALSSLQPEAVLGGIWYRSYTGLKDSLFVGN